MFDQMQRGKQRQGLCKMQQGYQKTEARGRQCLKGAWADCQAHREGSEGPRGTAKGAIAIFALSQEMILRDM